MSHLDWKTAGAAMARYASRLQNFTNTIDTIYAAGKDGKAIEVSDFPRFLFY